MSELGPQQMTGGCRCGECHYHLKRAPMAIHACHCRDCQRATGSAFALNLWIERDEVELSQGKLSCGQVEGGSKGVELWYCGSCGTGLWTRYLSAPSTSLFVRGGTLDDPSWLVPTVHIFTRSKQPWLELPASIPSFEAYYSAREIWSDESRQRLRVSIELAKAEAAQAGAP
jgi:hypothetical protein